MKNIVQQKGNDVEGDNAGGDIYKNTFNYSPATRRATALDTLSKTLALEIRDGTKDTRILEKLQHYRSQIAHEEVIGLEAKLREADMLSILKRAERDKEAFTKRLIELQLYPSAQRAFTHLLSEIYSRFHNMILPLIAKRADISFINLAVQEAIITPIADEIGDSPLELYQQEINGMLFFLTGNCHIRWIVE